MMMMMSRFCIVCFFLIILPAYVILGSLNTVSTMVELCNNRSIKKKMRDFNFNFNLLLFNLLF